MLLSICGILLHLHIFLVAFNRSLILSIPPPSLSSVSMPPTVVVVGIALHRGLCVP